MLLVQTTPIKHVPVCEGRINLRRYLGSPRNVNTNAYPQLTLPGCLRNCISSPRGGSRISRIRNVLGATAGTYVSSSRHELYSQCRWSFPALYRVGQGSTLVFFPPIHYTFRRARSVLARAPGAPVGSLIRRPLCLPQGLSACQMFYCFEPFQTIPRGSRPIQPAARKKRKVLRQGFSHQNKMALRRYPRWPRWPSSWPKMVQKDNQRGSKRHPSSQDGPRWPQDRSRCLQDGPRGLQDAPTRPEFIDTRCVFQ